ncbi:MAG: alkaline phosphatase D family protein [Acidobacteria bacterium]|nr:alkaline phosphatase D family protein [Acidobacteriota bacterium]
MTISRREFLVTTGGVVGWSVLTGAQPAGETMFRHGMASGDPLADRVILWTRIAARSGAPINVSWRIARDAACRNVVSKGTVRTSAARDYTVKVDARGLRPATTYYYRFEVGRDQSPIGRTRTLPVGNVPRVRLGVVSCSNYPYGFFNAYRCLAQRPDLDAVLHLGDYIYEYQNKRYGDGTPLGRIPDPDREIVTLGDYRARHAQYKTDPDLQEVHRQHPFIAVWDDHEIANNTWSGGAQNHNPEAGEGDWAARKAAAVQAYFEWMPIRETEGTRVYRNFKFGTLFDLLMLDTRLEGRDLQITNPDQIAALADPKRRLLSVEQEAWLFRRLTESARAGSRWRVLGQQVLFAPTAPAGQRGRNMDTWNGYQASRARVFDFLQAQRIDDLVVLTGDIHSSWAFNLPPDPWKDGAYDPATGRGSIAVEFVGPAVSSPGSFMTPAAQKRADEIRAMCPHLRYLEGEHRGYFILDVTPQHAQADWFFVDTVSERTNTERLARSLLVEAGSGRLSDARPLSSIDASPLAP